MCAGNDLRESSPIMSHPPRITCSACHLILTGATREHLRTKWNTRTPNISELVEALEQLDAAVKMRSGIHYRDNDSEANKAILEAYNKCSEALAKARNIQ